MAGFRSIMVLVGGPAGIAIIAAYSLYELSKGHDAAAKAAKDHSSELAELRAKAIGATESIDKLNDATKTEQLVRWNEKLSLANQNIADVKNQLKYGSVGGFFDQMSRHGTRLQIDLSNIRKQFQSGKISVDQYQESLWNLSLKYPDFTEQAKDIKEQVLALKAAELAASNAGKQIESLKKNTTGAPKPKLITEPTFTKPLTGKKVTTKLDSYYIDYDDEVRKANEWRENILKQLDSSATNYDDYKTRVNTIFNGMLEKARAKDLNDSKNWQDGITRSLTDVLNGATDMASQFEGLFKNAFSNMEDALVNFVKNGKLDFRSLLTQLYLTLSECR